MSLSSNVDALATRIGTEIKAVRTEFVKLTGAQTVAGVKTFSSSPVVPASPSGATDAAPKGYVDTATGLLVPKSTVTTKGDLIVATGNATVTRRGVGSNNSPLIGDSAQSDGVRWDEARSSEIGLARDLCGLLGCNCAFITGGSNVVTLTSTTRTLQTIVCRLPAGKGIGGIVFYLSQAMVGGAASMALYESADGSSSWTQIGANTTATTALQTSGKRTLTFSGSVGASNAWIAMQLTLTTAPTTYPAFYLSPFLAFAASSGHELAGTKNATTAPGGTLDRSTGWTSLLGAMPVFGLAA